jgi:hypothetical protein
MAPPIATADSNAITPVPRVINVDKHAAYPKAMADLKAIGVLPESVELRQVKYLNNIVEQDHRFIKRLAKPGMGFFSFETAERTLQGYEVLHMMRKVRVEGWAKQTPAGRSPSSPACLERKPKPSHKRSCTPFVLRRVSCNTTPRCPISSIKDRFALSFLTKSC